MYKPLVPLATAARRWEGAAFWLMLAKAAGLFSAAIGALVLLGWMLDMPMLKSIAPGWVAMKANTAAGFILSGLTLWLKANETSRSNRHWRHVEQALASVTILLGLFTMLEFQAGIDLGIDHWLFHEPPDAIGTLAPGRMAPATALCFVLLGSALLLDGKTRRSGVSISALALLMALLALAAGLVYLYDTDNLYGLGHIMQLAAHTALAFIVLAAGLLCSLPEHGVVALLRRRDSGGALARRLLPVTLLLPVLIGWLKLEGVRAGLYEPDFGMVLVALVYIVIFGLSVIWVAHFLSRIDAERERMNTAIASSEIQLRTLVGTIPDLIWLKDTQGVYLLCNPAFEHFFGAKADVIVGKTDYDFVAREQADFFRAKDRAVMAARGPLRNEEWLTLSDGQRILAETTKAPTFDPQGNLTGVLGIARDITRRHQSEETLRFAYAEAERLLEEANQAKLALISALEESKAASAALHQSEEKFRLLSAVLEQRVQERTAKLEAVNQELETFSYSVSHDLRAPLRAIAGFVELLRKHSYREIDDKGRHYMDVISESAIQMARLIEDILTFSRIGRVEMTKTLVSLDQVLTEVLHTLQPQIAERKIEWHIGPLPQVQGERTMLSLVLLNLLSNALKFTGTRETARIEVGQLDSAADAGETICYVRDNGVGFDMQYVSKLFGLFQRLHAQEQFEGTGVGLANVQRIIQRHGGRVWAESRVGEGATFYFALPNSGG